MRRALRPSVRSPCTHWLGYRYSEAWLDGLTYMFAEVAALPGTQRSRRSARVQLLPADFGPWTGETGMLTSEQAISHDPAPACTAALCGKLDRRPCQGQQWVRGTTYMHGQMRGHKLHLMSCTKPIDCLCDTVGCSPPTVSPVNVLIMLCCSS